jgi:DNA-binding transcriptional ArsR family regulator
MKVAPSALLPILRSDTVGDLLARLYLNPEQWLTPTQLANELGVSLPTVVRELDRMREGGLVIQERIGKARRVSANRESALFGPLTSLVMLTYGPRPVLEQLLSSTKGVEHALIYGSWAARYRGEAGPPPHDVDVLVVGAPDPDELFSIADEARRTLHRVVDIRSVTPDIWNDPEPTDPFLAHVKSRPMVELSMHRGNA